jgi:hypothetical protein
VLAVISYENDPKNVIELQKPSENGPTVYDILQYGTYEKIVSLKTYVKNIKV